jgi:hypothetical protein
MSLRRTIMSQLILISAVLPLLMSVTLHWSAFGPVFAIKTASHRPLEDQEFLCPVTGNHADLIHAGNRMMYEGYLLHARACYHEAMTVRFSSRKEPVCA